MSGKYGLFTFIKQAIEEQAWLTHQRFGYNGLGQKIWKKSGDGTLTKWQWYQGNIISTIIADGREIHDSYNIHDKISERCERAKNQSKCYKLGIRRYDDASNLIWQKNKIGEQINYTYDLSGRILSATFTANSNNSQPHKITYHYNSIGLQQINIDDKPQVMYSYNPITWKISDKEDHISHIHYVFDEKTNLPIKEVHSAPINFKPPQGIHLPDFTLKNKWDSYRYPLESTDAEGNIWFFEYDNLNRVKNLWIKMAKDNTKNLIKTITYDALSRPLSITNGIGIKREFIYNTFGQIIKTTDYFHQKPVLILSYTYDFDTSNIKTYERQENQLKAIQSFNYDKSNNLTDMQCRANNSNSYSLCPHDIDIKDSKMTTPPVILEQHYKFDNWNNIFFRFRIIKK